MSSSPFSTRERHPHGVEDRARPRTCRTQRGSAYLYVMVCLIVMGLLAVELIAYSTQARTTQTRRMSQTRADLATESLVQQTISEGSAQPLVVNSTRTLDLNGATATITVTDGSSGVPNSFLLSGTTTLDGQTYRIARYVGKIGASTPYNYAIYSKGDLNYDGKIVAGASGADGDVFGNGNIVLDDVPGSTINGDISAKSNVTFVGTYTVTGAVNKNQASLAMATTSDLAYYGAATYRSNAASFSTGWSFPAPVNGSYPIYYYSGDINVSGTISGKGTVYVIGNVWVNGNLTYASSSDQILIIATGGITFRYGTSQAVGMFQTPGTISVENPALTISRGILVGGTLSTLGGGVHGTLNVKRDNFLTTGTDEAAKLHVPGFWP